MLRGQDTLGLEKIIKYSQREGLMVIYLGKIRKKKHNQLNKSKLVDFDGLFCPFTVNVRIGSMEMVYLST